MIDTEKDNRKLVERAFLVGIQDESVTAGEAKEHIWELQQLVESMGVPVVGHINVILKQARSRFLLGSGKAGEIRDIAIERNIDCLVFDGDLSPSQQRNWEKLTGICVIDRQEVILDIFAQRASTQEATIQVDLARMQYSLPRLTRAWTHLSRQRGGAKGTRGEGEQQIEVDKRIIARKIAKLRKDLETVRKQRRTQRKQRIKRKVPQVAIVGYTNAGKSSLLNRLTGASVVVEDKLFATLDPTTRKIVLPAGNREVLLTDTVGFVRRLPHALVEAFKATLEEAALADYLIHVLDASSPHVEQHYLTTLSVLSELNAGDKEIITVFNKADLLNDQVARARIQAVYPNSLFISTKTGYGIDALMAELSVMTGKNSEIIALKVPPSRHDICSKAHSRGQVISLEYNDDGWADLKLSINSAAIDEFREFML